MTAISPTTPATTPATTPTTTLASSSSSAPSTSTAAAGQSALNVNESDFLKLLTTQLQNQDPTAPMDSNQFVQQLVSLSQVEQAVNTNTDLEKLISLNQTKELIFGLLLSLSVSSLTVCNSKFVYSFQAAFSVHSQSSG